MCYSYGSAQFSLNFLLFLIETDTVCVIRCMQHVSDSALVQSYLPQSLSNMRTAPSRHFRQCETKLTEISTTSRLFKDVQFHFTTVDNKEESFLQLVNIDIEYRIRWYIHLHGNQTSLDSRTNHSQSLLFI